MPAPGLPVIDVKIVRRDGKTHPVDGKDIAFRIPARQAVKKGVLHARPVLFEPACEMEIVVPEGSVGDMLSRETRTLAMHPGRPRVEVGAGTSCETRPLGVP